MKEKLAIIGQFPPPIHGLSKALKSIIDSKEMKKNYFLEKYNITKKQDLIETMLKLSKVKNQKTYLTISHSVLGNFRDLFIISVLLMKKNEVILHYHGGNYKNLYLNLNSIQKKMNRFLLNRVHKIIVLGESQKNLFEDVIDKKKVYICENFAEESVFINDEEYKKNIQIKRKSKKIKLLFLSNLIKEKGYEEVISAFKILESINSNVYELHIAGEFFDKNSEKIIKKMTSDSLYKNNFFYYGVVDGIAKKKLLEKTDIFLLPSFLVEGQPISVIEAMANGLLCITTEIGGVKDVVHEKNIFYVKERSIDSIVNMILSLDKETIYRVGYLNREKAKKRFTEEMYISRLLKILK